MKMLTMRMDLSIPAFGSRDFGEMLTTIVRKTT